jgi:hypothetical protein
MDGVRARAALALGLVLAGAAETAPAADPTPKSQAPRIPTEIAALAYIVDAERKRADSVMTGKATDIERILADDFIGVGPDGKPYDKGQMIARTRDSPVEFLSNRINDVKVLFNGDTAVAQGSETWVRRGTDARRGRFVWTDTWLRRHGQWQIIASEALIAPDAAN